MNCSIFCFGDEGIITLLKKVMENFSIISFSISGGLFVFLYLLHIEYKNTQQSGEN